MPSWVVLDLLTVAALLGLRLRLAAPRKSTLDDVEPASTPDSSVDRARATSGWAAGSRTDWDRHVRPVLARELTEILRARRDPASARVGERMFGETLWPWVDPNQPFASDGEAPGPGRDALARILDRLERL
jgi:hypothetical protein